MSPTLALRAMLGLAVIASLSLASCRGEGDANNETDTMPASTNDTTGSAGAADTTSGTGMAPGSTMATMSDANIVAKLAAMDSAEIELGRLGTEKAQNPEVKAYAQMMVDHHSQMKSEGAAMAQKESITPVLPPDDTTPQEMVAARDRLSALDAGAFDRAYMDQMVADHQKAVANINAFMGMAQSAGLKEHLQKGLPRVQAHLDHAMKLQQTATGTAAAH
jgi:putative membrane protein